MENWNSNVLILGLGLLFCCCFHTATAQKLDWKFSAKTDQAFATSIPSGLDSLSSDLLSWKDSYRILPEFARKNPTGYTFLCRLELKGEDKMRIPVWIKVDDQNSFSAPKYPHTYVRFKLLRF